MKASATLVAAMAALVCAGPLPAHHSISMIEISTPIWVTGRVIRYEPVNPHVMIVLEERKTDGRIQRWNIEGPTLQRLARMRVADPFLKTGDAIEVCGFAFKKGGLIQSMFPDADGSSLPLVHGHMLILPDGTRRLWGPYGKLDNCFRPGDQTSTWLEFLKADPLARDGWCSGRTFVRIASVAPKEFVDEIDKHMANPCH